ncbi:MAG TPA: PIN-like domain-containing protein [Vicinamibacterales bacterium]|nr:PIN-like domain-containing protein [Vicinamibacterales bacterium]
MPLTNPGDAAAEEPAAGKRRLHIPVPDSAVPLADFCAEALASLGNTDTRVYVDTSFLMFLTRIGAHSREQFFKWLVNVAPDRVHTPSWSVHEYLRHHGDKTLEQEVTDHCKKIKSLVGESLAMIQDFLDVPPGGTGDARIRARNALVDLDDVANDLTGWTKSYDLHAKEVIEFVNRTALDGGEVFQMVPSSRSLGAARYESRIPPGFKDGRKKPVKVVDSASGAISIKGANRYGDLMFWKELLDDAKTRAAKAIVILSNDGKTDWLMPRAKTEEEDEISRELRAKNVAVPRVHPMLSYEAHVVAGAEQVFILNRHFLGQCLSRAGEPIRQACASFIGVAIRTVGVGGSAGVASNGKAGRPAHIPAKVVPEPPLWTDPTSLVLSGGAIRKAIVDSRKAAAAGSPTAVFLVKLQDHLAAAGLLRDLLTGEELAGLGPDLTLVGRHVHDEAIRNSTGYRTALADLIATLRRCPPISAAYLYAGLMASAYLEPSSTEARTVPSTPDPSTLYSLQTELFATDVNVAVNEFFKRKVSPLIYLPSSNAPEIKISLKMVDNASQRVLSSIERAGYVMSVPEQPDPALSLNASEETIEIAVEAIHAQMAAIYGYPSQQLAMDRPLDQLIEIPPHFGLVDPALPVGDDSNG